MLEEDADCLVVLRDLAGWLLAQEPEKGGTRKSRVAVPQEWLEKIRKAWERTANGALERADRGGIDHHSLANRRNEAYRSGDLERTAELSREPNVHLGPQMFAELPGEQDSLDPRRGPSSGSARVSRGGCWLIVARYCRSSFRYYDSPGYRYISLGFHLLRIVPQRWALLHSYPVNHDVSNGRRQAAKAGARTPEPSGEPPASGWAIFPGESVMLAL